MIRATISDGPPGELGFTILIVRSGYAAECRADAQESGSCDSAAQSCTKETTPRKGFKAHNFPPHVLERAICPIRATGATSRASLPARLRRSLEGALLLWWKTSKTK